MIPHPTGAVDWLQKGRPSVKAHVKDSTNVLDLSYEWVKPGTTYNAEWSEKPTSPRRVVLIHPDRPDVFAELPYHAVTVLPDK